MATRQQTLLMTDEELGQYNLHLQNLNFDAADHGLQYRIAPSRDGVPYIEAVTRGRAPVWGQNSLKYINSMIYRGLVEVEEASDGHPIIRPKAQNPNLPPRQEPPMSWMTPDQAQEFDQALETVMHHRRLGNCIFETWRDDNTNLYTHTGVTDQAPEDDAAAISNALRIVAMRLHDGSAVRLPMPNGGAMISARWDLRNNKPGAEAPA